MHFGEEDTMIPPQQVERIKTAFQQHPAAEIYIYPNAGHAFYNQDRSHYNISAADAAHQRTLAFLKHYLS